VDTGLRRRLSDALGGDSILHDGAVLCPGSVAAVVEAMRIAGDAGLRLRISSGGRTDASAAPHDGAVLSLHRLAAIEVDAATGTARVEAGATVAGLVEALRAAAPGVPGLPLAPRSGHIGSLIARGELPRRSLCGVEAVLVGGDLVVAGGRIHKDVVGYDLTATLLGSGGRLAAVVAVQLRLAPHARELPVAAARGEIAPDGLSAVFDPQGILSGS
jgi:FAD/FMN-containing dehydrogenase